MPIQIGQRADHGFEQPLGLLSDCHRRIERFLGAMLSVARDERGGPLSAAGRDALERAATYFRTAAPKHTADEEESLFPLLRATTAGGLEASLDGLEAEHREAEATHGRVDVLVSRWLAEGGLPQADNRELLAALESLERTYADHIRLEDEQVFPAAARVLAPHQLEEVGRQMAERRGVHYRGPLARFLGADHERLHAFLDAALSGAEGLQLEPFGRFRDGILRHMAMEEKLLIPRASEALRGRRPPVAKLLRVDHGAIAALLVPPPTREIAEALREILARHDRCEEDAGGLYDVCDRALGPRAALELVAELREHPAVKVKPYNDSPRVPRPMWDAVERSWEAWKTWDGPGRR